MTRTTQTVWKDREGNDLIKSNAEKGTYFVVVGTTKIEQLRELGAAIEDVLAEHKARESGVPFGATLEEARG